MNLQKLLFRPRFSPDSGGGGGAPAGDGNPAGAAPPATPPETGAPTPSGGGSAPANPTPPQGGATTGAPPATGGQPGAAAKPADQPNPDAGKKPDGQVDKAAGADALAEAQAMGAVYREAATIGQVKDTDYLEHLATKARAADPANFNAKAFVESVKADPSKGWLFGQGGGAAPASTTTSAPPASVGPAAELAATQAAYEAAKAKGNVDEMLRLKSKLSIQEKPNTASIRG